MLELDGLDPNGKEARGKRLRYIRDEMLRMSRREFATKNKDLSVTIAALQNWEEARFKGLKDGQAALLVQAFKRDNVLCEKQWLLNGIGEAPKITNTFENFVTTKPLNETDLIAKELRLFRETYIDAVDAIITDQAFSPFFEPGDHVAGIRHIGNDIQKTIGQICIVQTEKGEACVRKVEDGDAEGCFNLSFLNKEKDLSELKNVLLFSSAPIVWWRRRVS